MGSNTFQKVLNKTKYQVEMMRRHIDHMICLEDAGEPDAAYVKALVLADLAERTTLLIRSLPVYTGNPGAASAVDIVIQSSIPLSIGYTREGWFSVRLPMLLPKKETGSAEYIRTILYSALRRFFQGKPPVRYQDCVLIYRHIYTKDRPERKKRDHDNIEVNMVSDTIALYVMPDDGPQVCSHYYCTAAGSEERTEVYVVPKSDFPQWLQAEKTMPEQGVMLYEARSKPM